MLNDQGDQEIFDDIERAADERALTRLLEEPHLDISLTAVAGGGAACSQLQANEEVAGPERPFSPLINPSLSQAQETQRSSSTPAPTHPLPPSSTQSLKAKLWSAILMPMPLDGSFYQQHQDLQQFGASGASATAGFAYDTIPDGIELHHLDFLLTDMYTTWCMGSMNPFERMVAAFNMCIEGSNSLDHSFELMREDHLLANKSNASIATDIFGTSIGNASSELATPLLVNGTHIMRKFQEEAYKLWRIKELYIRMHAAEARPASVNLPVVDKMHKILSRLSDLRNLYAFNCITYLQGASTIGSSEYMQLPEMVSTMNQIFASERVTTQLLDDEYCQVIQKSLQVEMEQDFSKFAPHIYIENAMSNALDLMDRTEMRELDREIEANVDENDPLQQQPIQDAEDAIAMFEQLQSGGTGGRGGAGRGGGGQRGRGSGRGGGGRGRGHGGAPNPMDASGLDEGSSSITDVNSSANASAATKRRKAASKRTTPNEKRVQVALKHVLSMFAHHGLRLGSRDRGGTIMAPIFSKKCQGVFTRAYNTICWADDRLKPMTITDVIASMSNSLANPQLHQLLQPHVIRAVADHLLFIPQPQFPKHTPNRCVIAFADGIVYVPTGHFYSHQNLALIPPNTVPHEIFLDLYPYDCFVPNPSTYSTSVLKYYQHCMSIALQEVHEILASSACTYVDSLMAPHAAFMNRFRANVYRNVTERMYPLELCMENNWFHRQPVPDSSDYIHDMYVDLVTEEFRKAVQLRPTLYDNTYGHHLGLNTNPRKPAESLRSMSDPTTSLASRKLIDLVCKINSGIKGYAAVSAAATSKSSVANVEISLEHDPCQRLLTSLQTAIQAVKQIQIPMEGFAENIQSKTLRELQLPQIQTMDSTLNGLYAAYNKLLKDIMPMVAARIEEIQPIPTFTQSGVRVNKGSDGLPLLDGTGPVVIRPVSDAPNDPSAPPPPGFVSVPQSQAIPWMDANDHAEGQAVSEVLLVSTLESNLASSTQTHQQQQHAVTDVGAEVSDLAIQEMISQMEQDMNALLEIEEQILIQSQQPNPAPLLPIASTTPSAPPPLPSTTTTPPVPAPATPTTARVPVGYKLEDVPPENMYAEQHVSLTPNEIERFATPEHHAFRGLIHLYMLLGTYHVPRGEMGKHDLCIAVFQQGPANTGKTRTSERYFKTLYGEEHVGIVNDNAEEKFGLSPIFEKNIYVAIFTEITPNTTVNKAAVMAWITDGTSRQPAKFKDSQQVEPQSKPLGNLNSVMRWSDDGSTESKPGCITRRICMVQMQEPFKHLLSDPEFDALMKHDLPMICLRLLLMRHYLVPSYTIQTFWKRAGAVVDMWRYDFSVQLKPYQSIMHGSGYFDYDEHYILSEFDFQKILKKHRQMSVADNLSGGGGGGGGGGASMARFSWDDLLVYVLSHDGVMKADLNVKYLMFGSMSAITMKTQYIVGLRYSQTALAVLNSGCQVSLPKGYNCITDDMHPMKASNSRKRKAAAVE